MFEVPIVLFLFRRTTSFDKIINQIRKIRASRVYLIADGPRNDQEVGECNICRAYVEKLIDWDCEIIKNYAERNRGVLENIGMGARWVFEREEKAIFLEDDNYPEDSFFPYCEDLLDKYKDEEKILWICGTNYVTRMELDTSYVFTQHLLPCGWASWSYKFLKYYDSDLLTLNDNHKIENFKKSYINKKLMNQQLRSVERTKYLIDTNRNKSSWDYQMVYSMRANNLFGIAPACNQIKNIGADEFSVHGGTSTKLVMTDRFCLVETEKLSFPLVHPKNIEINELFEKKIGNIILLPFSDRLKIGIATILKKLLGVNKHESFAEYLKDKRH